jgi:hypothetical protein
MRRRTCVLVAGFLATLLLGSACIGCSASAPSNPADPLPHGGSSPEPSRQVLSDAQIAAWLTAIQRYYQLAETNTVPQNALQACYLLTRAQVDSDLSHPAAPWYLQGPLLPSPPRVDHNSLECVVSRPASGVSLGTAYGDSGGGIRIHTAASPARPSPHREAAIPGTSWSLDYTAWHERQPTDAELQWVLNDVLRNLAVPPPQQPPSAFLSTH